MAKVTNEKRFKAIPQQLCMSEASPFCQPWAYASDHDMEHMLAPYYFKSEHDRLRAGDTIRIVQMEEKNVHERNNTVVEMADVTVISSSRDGVVLSIDTRKLVGDNDGSQVSGDPDSAVTVKQLNEAISAINEKIDGLEVGSEAIEKIKEEVELLKGVVDDITSAAPATPEGSVPPAEQPADARREWNKKAQLHEAVTGKGNDRKVLFSHKKKEKVDEWLQSLA